MKQKIIFSMFILLIFIIRIYAQPEKPTISEETEACIDCHQSVTPGIVFDWLNSLHSKSTLELALSKPHLERRVSLETLKNSSIDKTVVGCFECHGQNTGDHADSFEHFDFKINVIVTPNDCRTCHPLEVQQFSESKKSYAIPNLKENPVYHSLVETITSVKTISEGKVKSLPSSESAKGESCFACHGTEVEVNGMKVIETALGEIEVPKLTNWPNQGVGRLNPDGSRGSCTACHPRHSFSIEIARKPHTCGQCHLEPDVPAYNVYKESKHGNIYESMKNKWEWNSVPWTVGKDFTAPTCAACHNSLITDPDDNVIAERSHDFASRLWVRIFGLIYTHPQPKNGATFKILNKDKLPLPTTFSGEPASEYLIDELEQNSRKEKMSNVCKSCHGSSWTEDQIKKIDTVNKETDLLVKEATSLISDAWQEGIANNNNPFDEELEMLWIRQWLFYSNSIRYATAMMGPDYAAFKNGWWNSSENFNKMMEKMRQKRK